MAYTLPPDVREQVINRVIGNESGGNPTAQNPQPGQTAGGLGGFINSTWVSMMRRYEPEISAGRSDADLIGMKHDPVLGRRVTGHYIDENARYLHSNGFEPTAGNIYLAHFMGAGGAVGLLRNPNATVYDTLSQITSPRFAQQVLNANSTVLNANTTGADVARWTESRMGGPAPQMAYAQSDTGTGPLDADGIAAINAMLEDGSIDMPTLQLGDRDEGDSQAVSNLQHFLNSQGAQIGVDGDFGPQTQRALREYQARAGVTADGVAGPETYGSMQARIQQEAPELGELPLMDRIREIWRADGGPLASFREARENGVGVIEYIADRVRQTRESAAQGIPPAPVPNPSRQPDALGVSQPGAQPAVAPVPRPNPARAKDALGVTDPQAQPSVAPVPRMSPLTVPETQGQNLAGTAAYAQPAPAGQMPGEMDHLGGGLGFVGKPTVAPLQTYNSGNPSPAFGQQSEVGVVPGTPLPQVPPQYATPVAPDGQGFDMFGGAGLPVYGGAPTVEPMSFADRIAAEAAPALADRNRPMAPVPRPKPGPAVPQFTAFPGQRGGDVPGGPVVQPVREPEAAPTVEQARARIAREADRRRAEARGRPPSAFAAFPGQRGGDNPPAVGNGGFGNDAPRVAPARGAKLPSSGTATPGWSDPSKEPWANVYARGLPENQPFPDNSGRTLGSTAINDPDPAVRAAAQAEIQRLQAAANAPVQKSNRGASSGPRVSPVSKARGRSK